jgi:phage tail sheath protein FI
MPVRPTFPGVYIEEIPSGVRTITGVATSTGAFIGTFQQGLLNEAVHIFSMSDFEREFGGLSADNQTSYAVQQFFLNGGTEAWVVRVADTVTAAPANAFVANVTLAGAVNLAHTFAGHQIRGGSALNPGVWGNSLRLEVDYITADPTSLFNLTIQQVNVDGDRTSIMATELFRNLTLQPGVTDNALDVVNQGSNLIQLTRDPVLIAQTANPVPAIPALPAIPPYPRPLSTGTLGAALPVAVAIPANGSAFSVTLGGPAPPFPIGAIAGTIQYGTAAPPTTYAGLRPFLEQAIRRAATSALIPDALKPYVAQATVDVFGAGTAADQARFLVRLGRGARPFLPTTTITLTGAGATTARLSGAGVVVSPQQLTLSGGRDGQVLNAAGAFLVPAAMFQGVAATRTGLYALEDVDIFNVLCMPEVAAMSALDTRAVYTAAEAYVESRRAMLLVDIPDTVRNLDQMQTWMNNNDSLRDPNAAVYFPRTMIPDPLNDNRPRSVGASGTIAGLYARTDTQRGVWKAPAGVDARLRNVASLDYSLTDQENGALNPIGVNCLRTFPVYSNICWGARTLDGADVLASDWKYVPVRRLTLFLEESLYRGTKWVVFEPNDEPLWSQIRLNVGAFMQDLFRKGAFQGSSPRDAYFVKCDGETTTQTDIDNGIVNINVGFAPLKPAEFVILRIQQIHPSDA